MDQQTYIKKVIESITDNGTRSADGYIKFRFLNRGIYLDFLYPTLAGIRFGTKDHVISDYNFSDIIKVVEHCYSMRLSFYIEIFRNHKMHGIRFTETTADYKDYFNSNMTPYDEQQYKIYEVMRNV